MEQTIVMVDFKHQKPKTTERNVVCVSGIRIDENDYDIVRRLFPDESLSEMTDCDKELDEDDVPWIKINKDDKGSRVCEFDITSLPSERMTELIALDALECLHLGIESLNASLNENPDWIGTLRHLRELNFNDYANVYYDDDHDDDDDDNDDDDTYDDDYDEDDTVAEFHSSIFNLKDLKILEFDTMGLNLPYIIDRMTNLEELRLYYIRGQLSLGAIERLINLNTLRINHSNISSIPSSIGQLTNLKHIDFWENRNLKSVPDSIWRLTGLKELRLDYTGIQSLPSSIGNLVNLKSLAINFPLSPDDLPFEMGRLKRLEILVIVESENLIAENCHLIASILSRISIILEKMENVRSLFLPQTVFNSEDLCEMLLKTARRCPFLGCIGGIFVLHQDRPQYKALLNCLLQNRVRHISHSRTFPPSLWPLILSKAKFPVCTKYCCDGNCWYAGKNLHPSTIIFQLLVTHGAPHIFPKSRAKKPFVVERSIR